jgi:hypothetical protein
MQVLRRLASYRWAAIATVLVLTLPHACGF